MANGNGILKEERREWKLLLSIQDPGRQRKKEEDGRRRELKVEYA
jgi:hypothetical protein